MRWSPLDGCRDWSGSLRQAQAFANCAQSGDSDEARFWNGEAAKLLAPLLHAAALDDRDMADVLGWVNRRDTKTPSALLTRDAADLANDHDLITRHPRSPMSAHAPAASRMAVVAPEAADLSTIPVAVGSWR